MGGEEDEGGRGEGEGDWGVVKQCTNRFKCLERLEYISKHISKEFKLSEKKREMGPGLIK